MYGKKLFKFRLMSFVSVVTVNDDLVKDCLSVLYNCCICVSVLLHL